MSRDDAALEGVRWRTSSHGDGGRDAEGLEIGAPADPGSDDRRFARDAKDRAGGHLTFPARSFAAFVKSQRGSDRWQRGTSRAERCPVAGPRLRG
ncbi:DUF397 domain-containing protein [Saccharothrix syringae]